MRDKRASAAEVSELKRPVGFWLRFVSNHVSHAFARKLLLSGVTVAEWAVMREMFDEEETSPGVVAEQIGMTRGGVSKLVDRLVGKELADTTGPQRRPPLPVDCPDGCRTPAASPVGGPGGPERRRVLPSAFGKGACRAGCRDEKAGRCPRTAHITNRVKEEYMSKQVIHELAIATEQGEIDLPAGGHGVAGGRRGILLC